MSGTVPEPMQRETHSPVREDEMVVKVIEDGEGERTDSRVNFDSRPTWVKSHIRYLVPETLDYYGLPWGYDPKDEDYILIKENVPRDLQEELFLHTKRFKREHLARFEPRPSQRPGLDSDSDSSTYTRRRRRRAQRRRSRPPSRSHSRSRSQSPSAPHVRSSSDPNSNSDSYPESDTDYMKNSESESEPDENYLPPKDSNGVKLNLEIDLAGKEIFVKSNLSTQKTIDLAKRNSHLKDRLHLHNLTKASIMTAHQSTIDDDTFGAALDYLDGPKYHADSHFRWM